MSYGILTIAVGNKASSSHYGELAFNLALSLKANSPDTPIALAYSDEAVATLTKEQLSLFTHLVKCPPEYYSWSGGFDGFKSKMHIDQLSPFDTTIFLDADAIWLNKGTVEQYLEIWEKHDWLPMTYTFGFPSTNKITGHKAKYTFWDIWEGDITKLAEFFDIDVKTGVIAQYNTSFVYFKKTDRVKKVFERMREYYSWETLPFIKFASRHPDEAFFDVASAKEGVLPPTTMHIPAFTPSSDNTRSGLVAHLERYWVMTISGNRMDVRVTDAYHKKLAACSKKVKLPYFETVEKQDWVEERDE
jgi:hypothetical protein